MSRPKGYVIQPHRHNIVAREVVATQELLFIKSGKVRVDFFDDEENYIESRILESGDVVLLAGGGHGFEILETTEIIGVKQGPYCGEIAAAESRVRLLAHEGRVNTKVSPLPGTQAYNWPSHPTSLCWTPTTSTWPGAFP